METNDELTHRRLLPDGWNRIQKTGDNVRNRCTVVPNIQTPIGRCISDCRHSPSIHKDGDIQPNQACNRNPCPGA